MINRKWYKSYQMEGKLDQVKIYNRLLSSSETGDLKRATVPLENHASSSIFIYPNPTMSILNIKGIKSISRIELVNNLGQKMYLKNLSGEDSIVIDVSTFPSGYYILKMIKNNGGIVAKKLIKK